jgi:pilus assembly protein CpaE
LRTFVSHCDKLLWCTDQSVLDCRRNLAVLNRWREKGMKLDHAKLVVDRYIKACAPDIEALEKSFGLACIAVLPLSAELRLNVKNQGQPLFALAPREPLTQAVRTLGELLAKRSEGLAKPSMRWFERLLGSGQ